MSTRTTGVRRTGQNAIFGIITMAILATLATGVIGATQALAADTVTDANVAEAIVAAKTPQDHEAIAAYFRAQAAAQGEKVKLHEAMLKAWEKTVAGRSLENMRKHCNDLIAASRKAQKAYEAMADMHAHMGMGKM